MNFLSSILIGLIALSGTPSNIKMDERGKELYYKYEREEVGMYRARTDFTPPTAELPKREVKPSEQPESLSPFFTAGNTYYLDEPNQLQELVAHHVQIGAKTEFVSGYRIQVYAGGSRRSALGVKSQLLGMGIENAYQDFVSPNFVVRVGDFMDKEDAILFLRELRDRFPSAFIVPDNVKVPKYREPVMEDEESGFPEIEDDGGEEEEK